MYVDWPNKDPDEHLDYGLDWSDVMRNDEDTIESSDWSVAGADDALGISPASFDEGAHVTALWLSGGTVGETYLLTNTIVTAGGRVYERTAEITIREK